ncbi:hypothetical protein XENOCAPTIV_008016, partial [Xenoophorus captivus]
GVYEHSCSNGRKCMFGSLCLSCCMCTCVIGLRETVKTSVGFGQGGSRCSVKDERHLPVDCSRFPQAQEENAENVYITYVVR